MPHATETLSATLILNHEAGSLNQGNDAVAPTDVAQALRDCGFLVRVERVAPGALRQTIETAVARRPEAVLVGGGDGTISTAARCLVGTGIPLGVLPLGTLNHFARDLGLPGDWKAAVAALRTSERRTVDVAEVNGRIFINNCSLGSYPEAVRRRDALRRQHGHGKAKAMLLASIAVFRRLRRLRVRIDLPDSSLVLRTPFVLIGNNRYCGHILDETLRPRLDEGRLWIYTTRAKGRLALLRLAWQSFTRHIDEADALEAHAVTNATITSTDGRPLPIAADGELLELTAPLSFRSRPGALTVLAPKPEAMAS